MYTLLRLGLLVWIVLFVGVFLGAIILGAVTGLQDQQIKAEWERQQASQER